MRADWLSRASAGVVSASVPIRRGSADIDLFFYKIYGAAGAVVILAPQKELY